MQIVTGSYVTFAAITGPVFAVIEDYSGRRSEDLVALLLSGVIKTTAR